MKRIYFSTVNKQLIRNLGSYSPYCVVGEYENVASDESNRSDLSAEGGGRTFLAWLRLVDCVHISAINCNTSIHGLREENDSNGAL
ncbi:hypothetical protein J6590_096958 [Homalodisca vitripennis]|nr:hypothetical protein J6590_096958 [Homalodisca vitripennis]